MTIEVDTRLSNHCIFHWLLILQWPLACHQPGYGRASFHWVPIIHFGIAVRKSPSCLGERLSEHKHWSLITGWLPLYNYHSHSSDHPQYQEVVRLNLGESSTVRHHIGVGGWGAFVPAWSQRLLPHNMASGSFRVLCHGFQRFHVGKMAFPPDVPIDPGMYRLPIRLA